MKTSINISLYDPKVDDAVSIQIEGPAIRVLATAADICQAVKYSINPGTGNLTPEEMDKRYRATFILEPQLRAHPQSGKPVEGCTCAYCQNKRVAAQEQT